MNEAKEIRKASPGRVLRRAAIYALVGVVFCGVAVVTRADLRQHWGWWLAFYVVVGALLGTLSAWRSDMD